MLGAYGGLKLGVPFKFMGFGLRGVDVGLALL